MDGLRDGKIADPPSYREYAAFTPSPRLRQYTFGGQAEYFLNAPSEFEHTARGEEYSGAAGIPVSYCMPALKLRRAVGDDWPVDPNNAL